MITLQQINVPAEFRCHQIKNYPQDNDLGFEEWFGANYDECRNNSDRIYLPIYFTSYYNNHHHGKNRRAMRLLQDFLDRLDRKKKYFCIIQNDDNILNNVSHLDLKVFGMGCKGDVQLPLVCQPHKYEFKETERTIFGSFIGSITHPIRQEMIKVLDGREGYFISTEQTSLHSYCYILSQSKYVFSPRGYGKTSFRIQEALQYGATPVYLSDEFLYDEGCLCIRSLDEFFQKDHYFPEKLWSYYNKETFRKHYTYEAVANRIYENL